VCGKYQSHSGDGSDSEPSSADRSDSEISEQSDPETGDGWSKRDKIPNLELFFGNPGVNVDIDDPSDIPHGVSTLTGILLFAEQLDVYWRQSMNKQRIYLKFLKWTNITTTEMKICLGLILLVGQVQKDNVKDCWCTDPTITAPMHNEQKSF
jgi:hypothetical protein